MKLFKSQHGYTLLFAVLTASLVLGVAAFTVGVARKQYILVSTARDSIFSFYNADSAISCIEMSWENYSTTTAGTIKCNGSNATISSGFSTILDPPAGFSTNNDVYKASGYISFESGASCAKFDIWKGPTTDTTYTEKTVIEARGYNVCSNGEPSASSRTVERAIRITQ